MRVNFSKWLAGGIAFLLPLFFMLPPFAQSFEAQITYSKFWLCVLAGGIAYSVYLFRHIHVLFALVNMCILLGTVSVFNGELNMNLWPYMYWLSAAFVASWYVSQPLETKEFAARCIVWAACASSVLAFFQMMDLDPIMQYGPNITQEDRIRPIGMLGQTTKFGVFLAMALPIAIVYRDYVSIFCIAVALYATKSSFAYLAGAAGVLIVLRDIIGRKAIVYTVLGGISFVAFSRYMDWFGQMFLDNGRYAVWESALRAWIKNQPVLGFGAGSFGHLYHKVFQPKELGYGAFIQAHNDYVQWLFDFGLIGAVVLAIAIIFVASHYLFFWWFKFFRAEGEARLVLALQGTFAAILVNALGNFPFQLAPHYFIAVTSLAFLLKNPDNRID